MYAGSGSMISGILLQDMCADRSAWSLYNTTCTDYYDILKTFNVVSTIIILFYYKSCSD